MGYASLMHARERSRPRRRGTFRLLLGSRHSSALVGLDEHLKEILTTYEQSQNLFPTEYQDYPLILEAVVASLRTARLVTSFIFETILDEVSLRNYPYTVDWWAFESHGFPRGILLTVALRPCDLRELVYAHAYTQ